MLKSRGRIVNNSTREDQGQIGQDTVVIDMDVEVVGRIRLEIEGIDIVVIVVAHRRQIEITIAGAGGIDQGPDLDPEIDMTIEAEIGGEDLAHHRLDIGETTGMIMIQDVEANP
jgi:hypothetical protein